MVSLELLRGARRTGKERKGKERKGGERGEEEEAKIPKSISSCFIRAMRGNVEPKC